MFPQEFLDLQEEIKQNPVLQYQLADAAQLPIEDKMGIVCAFCGIVLDGLYDEDNLKELAVLCTRTLYQLRSNLITVEATTPQDGAGIGGSIEDIVEVATKPKDILLH
jgi:hypothetical protein